MKIRLLTLSMYAPLLFIILTTICMFLYTGGSKHEPILEGYTFYKNFFSDLGRTVAWSGEKNSYSCILFSFTAGILSIFVFIYFYTTLNVFKENINVKKLIKSGAIIGMVAAIHFFGIAFTPGDILHDIHLYFVRVAFGLIIISTSFYIPAILKTKGYENFYAYILIVFTLGSAFYFYILLFGPSTSEPDGLIFQVVAQKIIVYIQIISLSIQAYGTKCYAKNQLYNKI